MKHLKLYENIYMEWEFDDEEFEYNNDTVWAINFYVDGYEHEFYLPLTFNSLINFSVNYSIESCIHLTSYNLYINKKISKTFLMNFFHLFSFIYIKELNTSNNDCYYYIKSGKGAPKREEILRKENGFEKFIVNEFNFGDEFHMPYDTYDLIYINWGLINIKE